MRRTLFDFIYRSSLQSLTMVFEKTLAKVDDKKFLILPVTNMQCAWYI